MAENNDYKTEETRADEILQANIVLAELQREEKELQDALESLTLFNDYQSARGKRLNQQKSISELEAEYKKYAEDLHEKGLRNTFSIGTIQEKTVIEFEDQPAIEWALEKGFKSLLRIDRKGVEAIVKNLGLEIPDWFKMNKVKNFIFDRKGIQKATEDRIKEAQDG